MLFIYYIFTPFFHIKYRKKRYDDDDIFSTLSCTIEKKVSFLKCVCMEKICLAEKSRFCFSHYILFIQKILMKLILNKLGMGSSEERILFGVENEDCGFQSDVKMRKRLLEYFLEAPSKLRFFTIFTATLTKLKNFLRNT